MPSTCKVPPVPRANLLVGKLHLLHQSPTGFAKEFTHKRPERGNPLQCCNISPRAGKIEACYRNAGIQNLIYLYPSAICVAQPLLN